MNKEEFLDSGIIENCVLDVAVPEEQALLAEWIERDEEIKKYWLDTQLAWQKYIEEHATEPNFNVQDKIVNAIDVHNYHNSHPQNRNIWWAAAASILVSVGLMYIVFLHQKISQAESEIAQLQQTQKKLAYENLINKANYRNAAEQLAIIHKHGNRTTFLKGTELDKSASATVYWNAHTQQVFLNVENLPKPPQGMQYQLWAMVNGTPQSAGVIDIATVENYIYTMKWVDNVQAFAISLEKEGGAEKPNLQAVYAIGYI